MMQCITWVHPRQLILVSLHCWLGDGHPAHRNLWHLSPKVFFRNHWGQKTGVPASPGSHGKRMLKWRWWWFHLVVNLFIEVIWQQRRWMRMLAATGEKGVLMCSRRYARLVREHMGRCTKPEIKTQVMWSIFCVVLTSVVQWVLAYWCRIWSEANNSGWWQEGHMAITKILTIRQGGWSAS